MGVKSKIKELQKADLDAQTDKWFRQYAYLFSSLLGETWKKGQVGEVAALIADALLAGNKIMACGNGGSCSDSNHLCAEFNNQLSLKRTNPLPAIDLTAMSSTITAIANDWGYEVVFSKPVEGLGKSGDILIGISTSGNSKNVLRALYQAQQMGIRTILMTGKYKSRYMAGAYQITPDYILTIDSEYTALIQAGHGMLIHTLVGLVDYIMYDVDYWEESND